MAGLGIRLFTDEDVDADLASELRRHGYEVLSTQEAGRHNQRIPDTGQLDFATRQQRAILVHNIDEYITLAKLWHANGQEHCGIILSRRLPIGELVRRLCCHLDRTAPPDEYNTVLFLRPC
jgi:Domain of unknown function (DUF5615)